jgi:hypothetical protein
MSLLAIAVVLALSYFELGMTSGETLGLKISLRNQPVKLVAAVSFILGLFSDEPYTFFRDLATQVLGRGDEEDGNGEAATRGGGEGEGGTKPKE